jgi:hypothetical protein
MPNLYGWLPPNFWILLCAAAQASFKNSHRANDKFQKVFPGAELKLHAIFSAEMKSLHQGLLRMNKFMNIGPFFIRGPLFKICYLFSLKYRLKISIGPTREQ